MFVIAWTMNTEFKFFKKLAILQTLKLIDNGCRLAPPPGCPLEMYRLMITCWYVNAIAFVVSSVLLLCGIQECR